MPNDFDEVGEMSLESLNHSLEWVKAAEVWLQDNQEASEETKRLMSNAAVLMGSLAAVIMCYRALVLKVVDDIAEAEAEAKAEAEE